MATEIFERLDRDGDEVLSEADLKASPSVAVVVPLADSNGDGQLDREELSARFEQYLTSNLGLAQVRLKFTCNGRPLPRVKVTLTPGVALEHTLTAATAITNDEGVCYPKISGSDIPCVLVGQYTVSVLSDEIDLPAKYNQSTQLGLEVFPDSERAEDSCTYEFSLSTR
ncbi:EF-hand domain-containing protein [Aeoliella mucimassa]|uniref:EF hand n=1 Tax=Aeoliella mucimassa TaxID=2527972 RepID=A0A518APR4_9BACT|nr:hypothetical protein [Aeoliella mucimassa]QDU56713.1 EF hand [Aeoliella mucimassa]